MEVIRKELFAVLIIIFVESISNQDVTSKPNAQHKTTPSNFCPFTKIFEDIFKIHNKTSDTGIYVENMERAKIFLNTIAKVSQAENAKKPTEEQMVNHIIDSIKRIEKNMTKTNAHESILNEAIILTAPKVNKLNSTSTKQEETNDIKDKINTVNEDKLNISTKDSSVNRHYVEILTIEPNNTSTSQNTTHNMIEALKHLMPMFNSTLTKELHNITIIERHHNKNHSFTATKNVSTIIVTYCDKDNLTKINETINLVKDTDIKPLEEDNKEDVEFLELDKVDPNDSQEVDYETITNLTIDENKDLLEAAQYGIQKMHELYTVLEPKLYSMGLWLDETNPARYVAAFNAPTDDVDKFSRYGYASVHASAKFKELTTGSSEDGLQGREEPVFPSALALRQSGLLQNCPLRGIPKCPPASKRYRTHDGTCNNFNRPRWGSTMTPVQRFLTPSYSDEVQAPRISVLGTSLPSAREISATIHEDRNVESPGITHMLMQWGQFIDHDITSTSQSRGFNGSVPRCCKNGGRDFIAKELMHPECLPIAVPPTDPFYGPKGVRCLDFVRSSPAPRDDCALGWREQLNQVSGYIDGSPVYASSARQSDKLRLFRNGMLQYGRLTQRKPMLPPERRDELCRGGAVSSDCFKSGDARVNEHPGLVAAHIVWLRHHNRMAQELAHLNPHWSDEKIYQETRKIVGAMIQHITYREFLPIVLGTEVMRLFDLETLRKGYYKGYNPKINPSPASAFGSAAFRFGHSLVQSSMVRFDKFHRPMSNNVTLHNEPTNPANIWSIGAVDRLIFGMMNQPIQKRDEFISEELTNHLFQTSQFTFGMDLAAINIQRARDHGIASYTAWREPCGLSTIESFEDLKRVMPIRAAKKIKSVYKHVDDIDLFTGGMSERPVIGGLVGPTFACIIAQQFSNLRNGDRFWYENGGFESSFTPAQLQQIRRISLAHIICHTLDSIDDIQPFVFLSPNNSDNERISCNNGIFNNFDLSPWVEVDSESDNDISKGGDEGLHNKRPTNDKRPVHDKRPKLPPTTTKPKMTTKHIFNELSAAESNKVTNKVPFPNKAPAKDENDKATTAKTTTTRDTIEIDDKLDFRFFLNKSRRFENDEDQIENRRNNFNYEKPTKQYNDYNNDDYDDNSDNVQSVQSVVINNVPHKRPYNRPVIAVTENVDKFTYLINYVPRPTQPWRRPTTKRPTYNADNDRDVIKVTYQTYDDTYRPQRRPSQPYYHNRHDNDEGHDNYNSNHDNDDPYRKRTNTDNSDNYREITNTDKLTIDDDSLRTSARSNDHSPTSSVTKTDFTTTATPNLYKLVTFGYVGTYKGDITAKTTTLGLHKESTNEHFSKDYATYKTDDITLDINDKTNDKIDDKLLNDKVFIFDKKPDDDQLTSDQILEDSQNEQAKPTKLSTFYLYETATKPYNKHRPTRRNDEQTSDSKTTKYYYDNNVLRKYSDNTTLTKTDKDPITETQSPGHGNIEERAAIDKLALLDEAESKAANPIKTKKPVKPAKTPSVNFDVIPSENSPSRWAIYDEDENLPNELPQFMPKINEDPYALRELPRPIKMRPRKQRPVKQG